MGTHWRAIASNVQDLQSVWEQNCRAGNVHDRMERFIEYLETRTQRIKQLKQREGLVVDEITVCGVNLQVYVDACFVVDMN